MSGIVISPFRKSERAKDTRSNFDGVQIVGKVIQEKIIIPFSPTVIAIKTDENVLRGKYLTGSMECILELAHSYFGR